MKVLLPRRFGVRAPVSLRSSAVKTTRARVLWICLGGFAAILTAAWWGTRAGSARPDVRTAPNLAVRSQPSEIELDAPTSIEETGSDASPRSRSGARGVSAPSAAHEATGTLVVRVVDDATDAPLAGIALRIVRERGGDNLLATGTTDERGEARFEAVEANTVIVEARRAPPYARAFGAAWLEGDETETVVLAMGPGRTVRGRVVDDVGTPLARAVVAANDDFGSRFRDVDGAEEPDATAVTTLADGKFELANLASSPHQVWIERGAMVPRAWSPQSLRVRFEDSVAWARTSLEPAGENVGDNVIEDIGDIVVPRAGTWTGRVVDAQGAPIPGALVSAQPDRSWSRQRPFARRDANEGAWPGLEGFRLREQECLGDALGRFELRCRPNGVGFTVWTPGGLVQSFDAPPVEPGGRVDDLELRVVDASLLAIELVDGAGSRIRGPHAHSRGVTRPASRFLFGEQLAVSVRGEGVDSNTAIGCDPDGLFRVQIPGALRGASTVRVDMAGYAPVARAAELGGPEPIRFVLEPLTALRMRVRFVGNVTVDPLKPRRVVLHACIDDPALRRAARTPAHDDAGCCGLGATRAIDVAPGTKACELPVGADRPFFVSVRDQDGPWSQTFGPWRPGDSVHEVVVPELAPRVERERLVSPIRARVTDARTGEPIRAIFHFADPAEDMAVVQSSGVRFAVLDANGTGLRDAPAGRWRMSLRAEDYRSPPAQEVELVAGVESDLGDFALEPSPIVELALVGSSPQSARVDFADADARWFASSEMQDDRLVVRGDLPPRGIATVSESDASTGGRSQRIAFEYDGGGRLELRLAPWRAVEVRCPVAGPSGFAASLALEIVDPRFPRGGRFERVLLSERAADSDARRFSGWLTAGTYALRSHSLLLGSSETTIDVPAGGDDVVRVELRPAR